MSLVDFEAPPQQKHIPASHSPASHFSPQTKPRPKEGKSHLNHNLPHLRHKKLIFLGRTFKMCIGRIDQYHCGCFTGPKIFRCEAAQKEEHCDGIGPLITANILSFCDDCNERRKNNTIELKRIIDDSRESADAKAEAKLEAIRAAERKAAIGEIDIHTPVGGFDCDLDGMMGDGEEAGGHAAGVSTASGGEKARYLSATDGSQKGVDEKTGTEYNVNEVTHGDRFQPTCSSELRNFAAKVFCGCFKKA